MSIESAIAAAEGIRDLLVAEIERAATERQQVRELDAQAMLDWAQARDRFHGEAEGLQRELAEALTVARDTFGLSEVHLDTLATHDPEGTARLADVLEGIRGLAEELAEQDRLNRMVLERTAEIVQSYVSALRPGTLSYDRQGKVVSNSATRTTRISL